MFNRQSLHVSLLLWGCAFCFIAAICVSVSQNFDKEKKYWVVFQQVTSAILLLNDAFAWGYRGVPGTIALWELRISNFMVFACSDMILLLFHGYLCCYLFPKSRVRLRLFKEKDEQTTEQQKDPVIRIRAVEVIVSVALLLVVISQFTHLYYYIDEANIYHRNSGHILSMILPMTGMLLDLSLLIQYRKRVNRNIFRAMLSYIILPWMAAVIQTFCYGISLINITISVSMVLLFLQTTMEQGMVAARREQKLAQQEKILAQQKIDLMQTEKELTESRITAMMSQIRNHFIFNTLGMISGYCKIDPVKADEALTRFSRYLRRNMKYLEETDMIPFMTEIKQIEDYVALEQLRFENVFEFGEEFEVRDFNIPPLTVQPLVENAIKHGFTMAGCQGTVSVVTRQEAEDIIIEVIDDGAGFDTEKLSYENSIGLRNVRYRLKHMADARLKIESTPGVGTKAMILIPVQKVKR